MDGKLRNVNAARITYTEFLPRNSVLEAKLLYELVITFLTEVCPITQQNSFVRDSMKLQTFGLLF